MSNLLETVIELLKEVPPDTIMLRLLDGKPPRTAAMLIQLIEDRDEIGLQYASDVLRVARDLIARQATK